MTSENFLKRKEQGYSGGLSKRELKVTIVFVRRVKNKEKLTKV